MLVYLAVFEQILRRTDALANIHENAPEPERLGGRGPISCNSSAHIARCRRYFKYRFAGVDGDNQASGRRHDEHHALVKAPSTSNSAFKGFVLPSPSSRFSSSLRSFSCSLLRARILSTILPTFLCYGTLDTQSHHRNGRHPCVGRDRSAASQDLTADPRTLIMCMLSLCRLHRPPDYALPLQPPATRVVHLCARRPQHGQGQGAPRVPQY